MVGLNKAAAGGLKGLETLSQMKTHRPTAATPDCPTTPLLLRDLGSRQVAADFTGGTLATDGGVLLLCQVDAGLGVTAALAQCFGDQRQQVYGDHPVPQLPTQRVYGLALGHEDLNDHAQLRRDPLLAAACEKADPLGRDRFNPVCAGAPLRGILLSARRAGKRAQATSAGFGGRPVEHASSGQPPTAWVAGRLCVSAAGAAAHRGTGGRRRAVCGSSC